MGLKVIAAPLQEPLTLEEARRHLRYDVNDDSPPVNTDQDPWIERFIPVARAYCENWMERSMAPQTLELALDQFPADAILLERPPVQAIISVTYIDLDGAEQTLAENQYILDNYQEPCWLVRAEGVTWPATRAVINAVKVRYITGYTLEEDSPNDNPLPPPLLGAMELTLGALDKDRENQTDKPLTQIPLSAQALMLPYRIRTSMA